MMASTQHGTYLATSAKWIASIKMCLILEIQLIPSNVGLTAPLHHDAPQPEASKPWNLLHATPE